MYGMRVRGPERRRSSASIDDTQIREAFRCQTRTSRTTVLLHSKATAMSDTFRKMPVNQGTRTDEWYEEIIRSNGGYSSVGCAGDGWDAGGDCSVGCLRASGRRCL